MRLDLLEGVRTLRWSGHHSSHPSGITDTLNDELMGHEAMGRRGQHRGSAMGAHYRHTMPEMAARAVDAMQQRLKIVLQVAELGVESPPDQSALRAF
jgi:hypothetical protein